MVIMEGDNRGSFVLNNRVRMRVGGCECEETFLGNGLIKHSMSNLPFSLRSSRCSFWGGVRP